ncbi:MULTISPECIES: major capsid protein P2 [unclassified Pseudoalteromonas]|uniref:major capsid protein P2 n=1 Tax=unclassified Pseudoalteromonas TaxID=194690 RepID=UPI00386C4962
MSTQNIAAMVKRAFGNMQPTVIQLAAPSGVTYGEESVIELQAGLVYHSIELETNLKHVPTIEKITIDISGNPVVYASNEILNVLDKAYKKFQTTGRFVLELSKFGYRTAQGAYKTQLVTEKEDIVTLIVKFADKGENDPITPTLRAKAYVTDKKPTGRIIAPTRFELTQLSAAAGEHAWAPPASNGYEMHIQRMVFKEDKVKISEIRVKRGNLVIHRVMRSDLDFGLQRHAGVELQDGYCILDFTVLGFGAEGAMNAQDLNFEFVVDGPGAIKTYIDGFKQVKAAPTQDEIIQLSLASLQG